MGNLGCLYVSSNNYMRKCLWHIIVSITCKYSIVEMKGWDGVVLVVIIMVFIFTSLVLI